MSNLAGLTGYRGNNVRVEAVLDRGKWSILGWMTPIVGLLLIFWFSWLRVDLSSGQPICEGHVGEIYGDAQVGQTFAAPYSGLYRVDVLLLTYRRINTHDLVFHLKKSPKDEEDLLKVTINAHEIKDGAYFGFTFPRIPGSAGKTFFFYLDSPGSVPGDAITVCSKGGETYAKGTAYLNGSPMKRDLTFVAHYRPGLWETTNVVLDRLVENKPSIWGDWRLYLYLVFLYLVLISLLVGRIMEAGLSEQGMAQETDRQLEVSQRDGSV
jgi:hypothetical protein